MGEECSRLAGPQACTYNQRVIRTRDIPLRLAVGGLLILAAASTLQAEDPAEIAREASTPEYAVRYADAVRRGGLGDLHVIPALIRNLTDANARVREASASALRQVTGEDFGVDPARWQRWWAQRLLESVPVEEGGVDLLARIRSGSYLERLRAVERVGELGRREAVPVLIETLGHENMNLRWSIARSLQMLTGQDFGVDRARWEAWWDRLLGDLYALERWVAGHVVEPRLPRPPVTEAPAPTMPRATASQPGTGAILETDWRDVAANDALRDERLAELMARAGPSDADRRLAQREAELLARLQREAGEADRRLRERVGEAETRAAREAADRESEMDRLRRERDEAMRPRTEAAVPEEIRRDASGWPIRGQEGVYTIQRGDQLWKLATKWGTTIEAIMEANPQVSNQNRIYAGRGLVIPPGASAR